MDYMQPVPQECLGELSQEVGPPPDPTQFEDREKPAEYMMWGLLIAIIIFEAWALATHRNTISQRIQHLSKAFKWLKWIGFIGLAVLGWHIFIGFPW